MVNGKRVEFLLLVFDFLVRMRSQAETRQAVSAGERRRREGGKKKIEGEKLKNDHRLEKEETGTKIGRGRNKG